MAKDKIAALLDKAVVLINNLKFADAENILNEVFASGSLQKMEEVRAFGNLGVVCLRTSRYEEAIAHFHKCLFASEEISNLSIQTKLSIQAKTHNEIGEAKFNLGDDSSALISFENALDAAEKSEYIYIQVHALFSIGVIYWRQANYELSLDNLKRSNRLAEEAGLIGYVAKSHVVIGQNFVYMGDYSKALEHFSQTLALVNEDNTWVGTAMDDHLNIAIDKGNTGTLLNGMASAYRHLSDFAHAIECDERWLRIEEEIGNNLHVASALGSLGLSYEQIGDYPRALDYLTRSLTIQEEFKGNELDASRSMAVSLGNIGNIYKSLGDLTQAIEYTERAIEHSKQTQAHRPLGYWMHNKASIQRKLGDLEAASQGFLNTLNHRLKILKSNEDVSATLFELGSVLVAQGKWDEGLARLEEAIVLAEEIGEKKNASEAHKELAAAYAMRGDVAKAYEHLSKHLALDKEIFSEESKKKVETFNIRVAIAEKEHEKEVHRLKAEQSERELANSTLQLVAQTELLSELRDGLMGIVRKFPMPDAAAKELRERLKTLPCKAVDWEKFDTQFKSAHPEFTKKLLEKHSTLSPTELRICSLVRMNLKSEDIARLLCLSERTVENHRNHIRQKMKLKRSEELAIVLAKM